MMATRSLKVRLTGRGSCGKKWGNVSDIVTGQAQEGGRRGMRVNVTLPARGQVSVVAVEQAQAAYLFEAVVTVA